MLSGNGVHAWRDHHHQSSSRMRAKHTVQVTLRLSRACASYLSENEQLLVTLSLRALLQAPGSSILLALHVD